VRPVTVAIFFLGIFAGIAAPIFRRYGKAGIAMAGGAAMQVIVAVTGLWHQDMRGGLATVAANHCAYRPVLECEIPLLALAAGARTCRRSVASRRCLLGSAGRFMQRLQCL
jgi:hypothetical protein